MNKQIEIEFAGLGTWFDNNGTTQVRVPDHPSGSLLVAWAINRDQVPCVPSDADLATVLVTRSIQPEPTKSRTTAVFSKISNGSAQTLTFSGRAGDPSVGPYCGVMVFENASKIGNCAIVETADKGKTFMFPDLELSSPDSSVMAMAFWPGVVNTSVPCDLVVGMPWFARPGSFKNVSGNLWEKTPLSSWAVEIVSNVDTKS